MNTKPILLSLIVALGLLACEETESADGASAALAWNDSTEQMYIGQGKDMAQATFQVLSTTLKQTMEAEGPEAAVAYCQLQAYPLTDSLSAQYQARIKRSALKLRNPANAPDSLERAMLLQYQQVLAEAGTPTPKAMPIGEDSVAFFAPIILQAQCEVCHGTPGESLATGLLSTIRESYPNDEAVGFAAGDLRGIWSIRIARQ